MVPRRAPIALPVRAPLVRRSRLAVGRAPAPGDDALMRVARTLPILAFGFAPVAVAGVAPVLTLMAIVVHANVDWDWVRCAR